MGDQQPRALCFQGSTIRIKHRLRGRLQGLVLACLAILAAGLLTACQGRAPGAAPTPFTRHSSSDDPTARAATASPTGLLNSTDRLGTLLTQTPHPPTASSPATRSAPVPSHPPGDSPPQSDPNPDPTFPQPEFSGFPAAGAAIRFENARQIVELAHGGRALTREVRLSMDHSRLLAATTAGLFIFDIRDGQVQEPPIAHWGLVPSRQGMRFSASRDAGRVAVIEEDGQLTVIDLDGTVVYRARLRSPVGQAVLSPDGSRLVMVDCRDCSGSYEHFYDVLELVSPEPRRVGGGKGSAPVFSPDGRWMVVENNRTLSILKAADFSQQQTIRMDSSWQGYQLAFSPQGEWLAVAHDGQLDLWRVGEETAEPGEPGLVIQAVPPGVYTRQSLVFSPDGRQVALMDETGRIHTWSTTRGRLLGGQDTGLPGMPYWLEKTGQAVLVPLPPGYEPGQGGLEWLGAGVVGGSPRLGVFEFDQAGDKLLAASPAGAAGSRLCRWSGSGPEPSGCEALSGGAQIFSDGQGQVYGVSQTGPERWTVAATGEGSPHSLTLAVEALSLRPLAAALGGAYFAFGLRSTRVEGEILWVIDSKGQVVYRLEVLGRLQLAQFSAAGDRLLVLVQDDLGALPRLPGLVVYDLANKQPIFQRSVYARSRLSGAALSPGGEQAAYWLEQWGRTAWRGLSVVDLENLQRSEYPVEGWRLENADYTQNVPMAFFPGGQLLVIALGRQILLVDAATGQLAHQWNAHHGAIRGLAVSADSSLIASIGEDGFVRIWGLDL